MTPLNVPLLNLLAILAVCVATGAIYMFILLGEHRRLFKYLVRRGYSLIGRMPPYWSLPPNPDAEKEMKKQAVRNGGYDER